MSKISICIFIAFITVLGCGSVHAQTNALVYPFSFAKKPTSSQALNQGAYVMADNNSQYVAFVLQDFEHADYVLLDSNFRIKSKFTLPAIQTVFYYEASKEDKLDFVGATVNGTTYNFVYLNRTFKTVGDKDYYDFRVETVYFSTKQAIPNKQPLNIPAEEKLVTKFSENNNFYVITSIDANNSKIYRLASDGTVTVKQVGFSIPENNRKNIKQVVTKEAITLMVPGKENVKVTTIGAIDFSVSTKILDFQSAGIYAFENKFFVVNATGKKIEVNIFDFDGRQLDKIEINDDNYGKVAGGSGKTEEHKGPKASEKSLDDLATVIKSFGRLSPAISVERTKANQYLVKVGTYEEPTPDSYRASSFRFLLDPQTLKPLKGTPPEASSIQVKNYIMDNPQKMANQFQFRNKQYYGFYSGEDDKYYFQTILIRK